MAPAQRAKELGCTPLPPVRGFLDATPQPIDGPAKDDVSYRL